MLWVAAENELALQQSFKRIAVDGLKLPNAGPQSHQENMMMVRRGSNRILSVVSPVL